MGPQLKISSNRLEEPGIKLGTNEYKASGLSTITELLGWRSDQMWFEDFSPPGGYAYEVSHLTNPKYVNLYSVLSLLAVSDNSLIASAI